MKRNFSFYDAWFFFALLFKARGWTFMGEAVPWIAVFMPYLVETFFVLLSFAVKAFKLDKWFEFQIFRFALKLRFKSIQKKAVKEFKEAYEKGKQASNPGQFQDPANIGK